MTKRARQRTLLELVREEPLGSQREILDRLRSRGFEVTQPTVSRDVEELGLARLRDDRGRLRYASPQEAAAAVPVERLRRVLQEFVLGMEASGNLVVILTPPGAANTVAEALDHAALDDVIGTVAGDNTILVVAREGVRGRAVRGRLQDLLDRGSEEAG